MFKEVLQSIDGVAVFPVISLVLFFTFFVSVCVIWFRKDKKTVDEYAQIPLGETDNL